MVDFVNIVKQLIEEHDYSEINHTMLNEGISKPDGIYNIHFDETRYNEAKSVLQTKYTGILVPDRPTLGAAIKNLHSKNVRGGAAATLFPDLQEWFPIFDLLCQFNSSYEETPWATVSASDQIFTDWKKRVNDSPSDTPLEYVPLSIDARIIKDKLLKQSSIGQLRIQSLPEKFSFYSAVHQLLDIRRKSKRDLNPGVVNKLFDTDGVKVIDHILYKPTEIISGSFEIDKKLEVIFDYGIVRELTSISTALYGLFKAEINQALSTYIGAIQEKKTLFDMNFSFLDEMMSNPNPNPPGPIPPGPIPPGPIPPGPIPPTPVPTPRRDAATKAKLNVIESLLKDQSLYVKYIGKSGTTDAESIDYKPIFDKLYATLPAATITTPPTGVDLSIVPPFKDDDKSLTYAYTYNIGNLRNSSDSYIEAKAVRSALDDTANHIAVTEPKDLLDGLGTIAGSLSLGVKNMGNG